MLTLIQEHNIDLVIAEVMLHEVCGFEICRRIRSHPDLFMLPIILISTMSEPDEILHGLAQGADEYLAKPCDPKVLIARIAEQLKNANAAALPDPVTQLSNARFMKALLQQYISRKMDFAAVYIEIVGLTQFGKTVGNEARNKALRHLARTLERYCEKLALAKFHAAHMGGGHFMCIMEPKPAESFCKSVLKSWATHLSEFYAFVGLGQPGESSNAISIPVLALTLCVTDNKSSGARSVQEYFDVLAQLRQKSIASGSGGIYIDNRRGK